jgi:hypothetical protein
LLPFAPASRSGRNDTGECCARNFPHSISTFAVRGAGGNILRKYRDQPADFADACLIHLADQLNTGEILTLDRDFMQYRWRKTRRFDLLIDLN